MDEWEAKYKILASGIADAKAIEAVECLFEKAKSLNKNTGIPFGKAVDLVLQASKIAMSEKPKEFLGFPVETGNWVPANKVMIFGNFGAIITDLQTGECKVASKEILERALRNIVK